VGDASVGVVVVVVEVVSVEVVVVLVVVEAVVSVEVEVPAAEGAVLPNTYAFTTRLAWIVGKCSLPSVNEIESTVNNRPVASSRELWTSTSVRSR
jgi:hypothetical protein